MIDQSHWMGFDELICLQSTLKFLIRTLDLEKIMMKGFEAKEPFQWADVSHWRGVESLNIPWFGDQCNQISAWRYLINRAEKWTNWTDEETLRYQIIDSNTRTIFQKRTWSISEMLESRPNGLNWDWDVGWEPKRSVQSSRDSDGAGRRDWIELKQQVWGWDDGVEDWFDRSFSIKRCARSDS